MPSVHDHHLYGYEYDARSSTLVLRTRYPHAETDEFTDVWFHGVWTHHLESILGHDIIFDIEDSEVSRELESFGDLFTRLERYGWPRLERRDDSLQDIAQRHDLRVWHIASSYGVSGFVVARRVERVAASEHKQLEPPTLN